MKTIHLVDYTYAETCEDEIRIHRDTLNDPSLFSFLLKHEFGHHGLTWIGDLKHDLKDLFNFKMAVKGVFFYFKHPKIILRMISPIIFDRRKKQIEINPSLMTIYLIEFAVCVAVFQLFI